MDQYLETVVSASTKREEREGLMVKNINLRPYQIEAIAKIDDEFRKGSRRVLFVSATGSGKTETLSWMVLRAVKHNFPVVFIVRGRNLVHNASERFTKNGIDHSVYMAGSWKRDPKKIVQICSIDTLVSRNDFPFSDKQPLVILDEGHLDYRKAFEAYPNAYVIGATGSPFTDVSIYDSYVQTIEPYELRDLGFLVPDKFYVPHLIDVSAVKIRAGDFDKKQLESVVTQSAVVGNVILDWKDLGQNRPTIAFASSIEHSLQLKQSFCEAGIPARHIDASSTDDERKLAIKELKDGKIKVICNVDILSIGVDIPFVSCIVIARPTFSLAWHIQSTGRGLRPSDNKSNCIFIDSAGNCLRHGSPYRVREVSLDKPTKKKGLKYDTRVTTCEQCYLCYDPTQSDCCPECGHIKPKKDRRVNQIDGKLIEYEESPNEMKERRKKMIVQKFYELEWGRKKGRLHPDWSFIQLFKTFSREEMAELNKVTRVPDRFLPLQLDHQN